jgi:hypothetical protein
LEFNKNKNAGNHGATATGDYPGELAADTAGGKVS